MNLFNAFVCLLSIGDLTMSPSLISVNYNSVNSINLTSTQNNPFVRIGGFLEPFKILENSDGYAYYNTEVYKANYTSTSNLYIFHAETVFTPGAVARINGEKQSNGKTYKDYMLDTGYVHLSLKQYKEGDAVGGDITSKLLWPSSSSVTSTFTSSFGNSLSNSFNLGGEVSLGNGGSLKLTTGASNQTSLTFSYNESTSSVVSDPMLSSQLSPSNSLEAQWTYQIVNKDIAGRLSYHLDTYYMFEMKTNAKNCNVDAFVLDYQIMFQNQYIGFLWATYDGWTFNNSVTIYNFI